MACGCGASRAPRHEHAHVVDTEPLEQVERRAGVGQELPLGLEQGLHRRRPRWRDARRGCRAAASRKHGACGNERKHSELVSRTEQAKDNNQDVRGGWMWRQRLIESTHADVGPCRARLAGTGRPDASRELGGPRALDPRCSGARRSFASLRHAHFAELLVRRGPSRPRAPSLARRDAALDDRARDQPAAVLRARLGVGQGVRQRRSRPALAVCARRLRCDPDRLPVWSRARLAPGRPRRGGAGGGEPVHDLVLAGSTRVHAPGRPVRPVADVLRAGAARTVSAPARLVGARRGARGADPLVRGLPRRARGASG